MAFVKLATIADVPLNTVRMFEHEGEQIAVYNCDGTFYATANVCTHAYAELHEGEFDADDCTIECPLHGAKFSVETGAVLVLPAFAPLDIYAVQVAGEDVLVDVP